MASNNRLNKRQDLIRFSALIAILLLTNVIASFLFTRFDLTAEKRYSLSPTTKDLLSNLHDVVYVKVYLEGEFPAGFKKLRNSTREMLDEFRVYANGNIEYEFINPSVGANEKERNQIYNQLADKGLQPTNLETKEGDAVSSKIIFPGAIMTYINRDYPIQLLKNRLGVGPDEMLNNSIESLEYELANGIRQLTRQKKPRIAFDIGHGEPDSILFYDLTTTLKANYDLDRMTISGKLEKDSLVSSLSSYDVLIVAKPTLPFQEQEKFLVDQFVMRGGRVLWMIDGMAASMDSLKDAPTTIAIEQPLNLEDQLFNYGVRINPNMVLDLKCSPIPMVTGVTGNQPHTELRPWVYFPVSFPENTHPIVRSLNAILLKFASSIDTVGAKSIKKTILLSSSQYTKTVFTPARISLSVAQERPVIEQYNKHGQIVSVLLEGQFRSVFTNRVPLELQNYRIGFKNKSISNKMIVVSDGDVAMNDVKRSAGRIFPLGYDSYTKQQFGNKNFMLNCIDYLCDDSNLIELRAKELKLRLLDKTKMEDEKLYWQITNTAGPVLLLILLGLVQFFLRKKKYGV